MLNLLINTAYAVDVIDKIKTNIFNPIIGILFGISFLIFLYGVTEFIQGASNEKEVENGKRHIIWGILGLVIIVGVNGLIALISGTVSTLGQ